MNKLQKWQPIETAPKDGADVLLWERYSDVPFVGYWYEKRFIKKWAVNTEHYCINGDASFGDQLTQNLITHWMPLPDPPSV